MARFMTSREVGAVLRALRLRAGLTQEELAERVGVTFQQIQKYESGSNKLNTDKLQAVASALGVKVSAVFDESIDALPLSPEEGDVVAALRRIQDKKIRDALVTIITASGVPKI